MKNSTIAFPRFLADLVGELSARLDETELSDVLSRASHEVGSGTEVSTDVIREAYIATLVATGAPEDIRGNLPPRDETVSPALIVTTLMRIVGKAIYDDGREIGEDEWRDNRMLKNEVFAAAALFLTEITCSMCMAQDNTDEAIARRQAKRAPGDDDAGWIVSGHVGEHLGGVFEVALKWSMTTSSANFGHLVRKFADVPVEAFSRATAVLVRMTAVRNLNDKEFRDLVDLVVAEYGN